jgi:monoamine oxidase
MPRKAAKTPLARILMKCLAISSKTPEIGITRRDFLKASAATVLAASLPPILSGCKKDASQPRVAIIGAGISGLNAAYHLKKRGIQSTIYEASPRTGGRMMSVTGALGPGLVTEFGGEFIDSTHADIISLASEFGLELMDRQKFNEIGRIPQAYFFDGRKIDEKAVIAEFSKVSQKIQADIDSLPEFFDFEHPNGAEVLDRTTLADYIANLSVSGWMKDLLEVAFITEYGLEIAEQSAINMLYLISTDMANGTFDVFGESDERFKVKGGNQRIPDELAKRLEGSIETSHKLEAISYDGKQYKMTFQAGNATKDISADIVLLTMPFSVLREVDLKIELPAWKRTAINELGYGTNAKVMAGVTTRVWQQQGYVGDVFTDESYQLAWDCSEMQGIEGGGVAFYLGGKKGVSSGEGPVNDTAMKYLGDLNKMYPGVKEVFNGKAHRMHWPSHRFTKGSYACYKPGQWTTISGAEGKQVGNLFFAGEHCSRDFQGFMNGGAETGRKAAEAILGVVRD